MRPPICQFYKKVVQYYGWVNMVTLSKHKQQGLSTLKCFSKLGPWTKHITEVSRVEIEGHCMIHIEMNV